MRTSKKRLSILTIAILIIIVLGLICFVINMYDKEELVAIKSKKELNQVYDFDSDISEVGQIAINIITMPFSFILNSYDFWYRPLYSGSVGGLDTNEISMDSSLGELGSAPIAPGDTLTGIKSPNKDYSTTNIQVEDVDEADITKTDGDYIYSISEDNVIITDVRNPQDIKIVARINSKNVNATGDIIPSELMLYNNKLAVIYSEVIGRNSYISSKNNTIVEIYDIQNREKPILEKEYTLYEPYYTSRCIENKLYVISSGALRKEDKDGDVSTYYKEDRKQKEISLNDIKYLKNKKNRTQTLISSVDLNDTKKDIKINSYLLDVGNAYISENNMYLLSSDYQSENMPKFFDLFGLKGIFGVFDYDCDYNEKTEICKFKLLENGSLEYIANTKVDGTTINQFSLDEYNKNLRVALYDDDGSRIVVLNDKLEEIGRTENLAKGENMYSSRFMGNKAYLVTYKTIDPLYVIDLSTPETPKVLGKLKIPGYSTYLHPYDEEHIIGIGMQTEEIVNRDYLGKVVSVSAKITGMKMALFDVSDVNNPIQISDTIIGDNRTTSAILTNHKALLFSKEKELLAIPVNNYSEDFEVTSSLEEYSDAINSYKNYKKEYVAEGYFVYNLNLKEGFKLKGVVTHDVTKNNKSYFYTSKLLRGMYIDNNLYTVSETGIKVNALEDLTLVNELKITNNS